MFNDLKAIHQRDSEDTLGIAEKQFEQYAHNFGFKWQAPREIREVIVAGMGGSGLAAKAYKVVGGLALPFEVVQSYDLPKRAGEHTLLICSSYSGNTEETLSVLEQALGIDEAKRPMTVVVASGGRLLDIARENNLQSVELPGGLQPRYTFGWQYRALTEIFEAAGLSTGQVAELEAAAEKLHGATATWRPDVLTAQNRAKQIALDIIGKSAVIYAGPKLFPAAYKWKISFNENAKHVAWCNQYPEFNHNEFIGWTRQPVDKPYAVVELRSRLEHPQVTKRFDVSERLLSGLRPAPIVVEVEGETLLEQTMWAVALGDFVTLYTALLNGLNPAPVELIERFKQALKD